MKIKMNVASRLAAVLAIGSCAFATQANATVVAIINGSSGTSEPGTTTSITTNLVALHTAAGNTVTVFDTVPAAFTGFQEIWDIRFSNNLAITGAEQNQYMAFLQGGGGMFVMGENSSFATRNTSVLNLITAAGGGTLGFTVPNSTQTVNAPFTGPNAVSSINYNAPGGVGANAPGTGQFITEDSSGNGTGLAFGVGTLANAPTGALTTIFDVNFMDGTDFQSQQLTKNLIHFVGGQVDPPTPSVPDGGSTLAMLGLTLLGLGRLKRYIRA